VKGRRFKSGLWLTYLLKIATSYALAMSLDDEEHRPRRLCSGGVVGYHVSLTH
jgi:hypothetical protein